MSGSPAGRSRPGLTGGPIPNVLVAATGPEAIEIATLGQLITGTTPH
jgi:hypothetical protein